MYRSIAVSIDTLTYLNGCTCGCTCGCMWVHVIYFYMALSWNEDIGRDGEQQSKYVSETENQQDKI